MSDGSRPRKSSRSGDGEKRSLVAGGIVALRSGIHFGGGIS